MFSSIFNIFDLVLFVIMINFIIIFIPVLVNKWKLLYKSYYGSPSTTSVFKVLNKIYYLITILYSD